MVSASLTVAAIFGVRSLVLPPGAGRGSVTCGPVGSMPSVGSVPGVVPVSWVSDPTAFSRPFVATLPRKLAFSSAFRRICAFIWVSASGPRGLLCWLAIRAATPETWGVAIEVPL